MNDMEGVVERHYWKAVTFLVILILVGTGFWGVRRFAPTLFLGEPDLIAVPNTERPQDGTTKSSLPNKPAASKYQYCLCRGTPDPSEHR